MKNLIKTGFLAMAFLLLAATGCKKGPEKKLYKTWKLSSVEMPNIDQVAAQAMVDQGTTYTFSKDGKYNYNAAGMEGNGTFSLNKEATQITTTENGTTDTYNLMLSDATMEMSGSKGTLKFNATK